MDAEDALDSERYERYMDDFDWYPDHSDGEEDVSKLPSDDYMSFTDELDIKPGWSSQTVAEEMLKSVQESRRAFLRYCWSEMIDKYGMIGVVTAFPIVRQEAQSAIDRATLSTVYNASTGDGFSRGRGQGKKRGRGRGGLSFWTPPRSWPLSTSVRELVGFDDIDDTGGFDYDVLPQDGRIRAEVLQLIADQTVRLYMDRNKHCGKKHDLFVNNRPFQYFNSRSSENHFQCAASLLLGPEDEHVLYDLPLTKNYIEILAGEESSLKGTTRSLRLPRAYTISGAALIANGSRIAPGSMIIASNSCSLKYDYRHDIDLFTYNSHEMPVCSGVVHQFLRMRPIASAMKYGYLALGCDEGNLEVQCMMHPVPRCILKVQYRSFSEMINSVFIHRYIRPVNMPPRRVNHKDFAVSAPFDSFANPAKTTFSFKNTTAKEIYQHVVVVTRNSGVVEIFALPSHPHTECPVSYLTALLTTEDIAVNDAKISPCGKVLACVGDGPFVWISAVEMVEGSLQFGALQKLTIPDELLVQVEHTVNDGVRETSSAFDSQYLSFSANSSRIGFSSNSHSYVYILDVATRVFSRFKACGTSLAITFHPTISELLAFSNRYGFVHLLDVEKDLRQVLKIEIYPRSWNPLDYANPSLLLINGIQWSDSGHYLYVTTNRRTQIYTLAEPKPLKQLVRDYIFNLVDRQMDLKQFEAEATKRLNARNLRKETKARETEVEKKMERMEMLMMSAIVEAEAFTGDGGLEASEDSGGYEATAAQKLRDAYQNKDMDFAYDNAAHMKVENVFPPVSQVNGQPLEKKPAFEEKEPAEIILPDSTDSPVARDCIDQINTAAESSNANVETKAFPMKTGDMRATVGGPDWASVEDDDDEDDDYNDGNDVDGNFGVDNEFDDNDDDESDSDEFDNWGNGYGDFEDTFDWHEIRDDFALGIEIGLDYFDDDNAYGTASDIVDRLLLAKEGNIGRELTNLDRAFVRRLFGVSQRSDVHFNVDKDDESASETVP